MNLERFKNFYKWLEKESTTSYGPRFEISQQNIEGKTGVVTYLKGNNLSIDDWTETDYFKDSDLIKFVNTDLKNSNLGFIDRTNLIELQNMFITANVENIINNKVKTNLAKKELESEKLKNFLETETKILNTGGKLELKNEYLYRSGDENLILNHLNTLNNVELYQEIIFIKTLKIENLKKIENFITTKSDFNGINPNIKSLYDEMINNVYRNYSREYIIPEEKFQLNRIIEEMKEKNTPIEIIVQLKLTVRECQDILYSTERVFNENDFNKSLEKLKEINNIYSSSIDKNIEMDPNLSEKMEMDPNLSEKIENISKITGFLTDEIMLEIVNNYEHYSYSGNNKNIKEFMNEINQDNEKVKIFYAKFNEFKKDYKKDYKTSISKFEEIRLKLLKNERSMDKVEEATIETKESFVSMLKSKIGLDPLKELKEKKKELIEESEKLVKEGEKLQDKTKLSKTGMSYLNLIA